MSALPPVEELDEPAVEVFRSHDRPACDERAFVLHAVGIASEVVEVVRAWSLIVPARLASQAARELRTYDRENPPRRRLLQPHDSQPGAWIGPLAYVTALLLVAWLAGHRAFRTDWLDAGSLNTMAFRAGEAWRAVTAVTLHLDVGHLLGNLGFGAFFGWLAAQLLGPGLAFGTGLAAAAIANAINGSLQPAEHVSAGASTMVFALLGLVAAYAWRRRTGQGERWAYRWAPLIAGVFMLAFTGAGGDNTDVLAHLTGFAAGGAAGFVLALRRRPGGPLLQWLAGLAALLLVALCWYLALNSSR